jgi:seryl-tRNA synthetase
MSSGFVSAGTLDEPVERDDEWRRVQQELEEERRQKAELGKQNDGKSLYEVLQQNKSECPTVILQPKKRTWQTRTRLMLPLGVQANVTG